MKSLTIIFLFFANATASPNIYQSYSESIWKMYIPTNETTEKIATAFLIDNRGYFVSVAHAVATGANDYSTDVRLELFDNINGNITTINGKVVANLCVLNDTDANLCTRGIDLILIKTESLDKYKVLEINLQSDIGNSFEGIIMGYPISSKSLMPQRHVWLSKVNKNFNHLVETSIEENPKWFYMSGENFSEGFSGAPVIVEKNNRYEVASVVSWKLPGRLGRPQYQFNVINSELRQIIEKIEIRPNVLLLNDAINNKEISLDAFKGKLSQLSNLELSDISSKIVENDDQSVYRNATLDFALLRGLDKEAIELSKNIENLKLYQKKDLAKAYRRTGILLKDKNKIEYKYFLEEAKKINNNSFQHLLKSNTDKNITVKKNLSDLASEQVILMSILENKTDRYNWAVVGAGLGNHNLTFEVAKYKHSTSNFKEAAALYGLTYEQASKKNVFMRHLEKGYKDAIEGMQLSREYNQDSMLPKEIEAIDVYNLEDVQQLLDEASKKIKVISIDEPLSSVD